MSRRKHAVSVDVRAYRLAEEARALARGVDRTEHVDPIELAMLVKRLAEIVEELAKNGGVS